MKKKKKKLKGIIILLIIIIIILLIISKMIKSKEEGYIDEYDNLKYINLNQEETLDENIVIPVNTIDFFKNYFGKIESKNIYQSIDNFAKKILPKYINELKNTKVLEYYNLNTNNIKEDLGIENLETFEKFAKKLENIAENNFIIKTIKFDKEKIYKQENGTSAALTIEYKNNQIIEINIYVPNERNTQNIMFN